MTDENRRQSFNVKLPRFEILSVSADALSLVLGFPWLWLLTSVIPKYVPIPDDLWIIGNGVALGCGVILLARRHFATRRLKARNESKEEIGRSFLRAAFFWLLVAFPICPLFFWVADAAYINAITEERESIAWVYYYLLQPLVYGLTVAAWIGIFANVASFAIESLKSALETPKT